MTKGISVRIDETLLQVVDDAGKVDNKGRSQVVREALELWLRARTIAEKVERHREGYIRHPVASNEFSLVLGAQTWPK